MNKHQAQEWMSRFVDGELTVAERAELERYLAAHPEERAFEQELREVGDLVRAERVEMPTPEAMWADVQRAIRLAEPEPRPAGFGWRLKWAAAFIGLAMMGLGLWAVVQDRPSGAGRAEAPAAPVVEWAEAEWPGTSTMVYEDAETDTVVIWLVAENDADTPKGS